LSDPAFNISSYYIVLFLFSDPAVAANSRGLQLVKEVAPKRSLNLAEYKKMKGLI
jgi:hypothetical protein